MALTCKLSELVDQIHRSMIPLWILNGIADDLDNCIATLNRGEEYRLNGPNGEVLIISASRTRSFVSKIVDWFRKGFSRLKSKSQLELEELNARTVAYYDSISEEEIVMQSDWALSFDEETARISKEREKEKQNESK